jgi:hypothetical protein
MFGRAAAIAIAAMFCIAIGPAGSQPAKKKCRIVVRVVHGRKRQVKVCTKPKPPAVKNVTLKLDTAHSATGAVPADGGAISATTASGTKLTLTVPKDAVPADTLVTLTPVSAISGLKGKLIAGVQFAPEGLVLAKPATLTIQSSATTVTGVAWIGSGKFVERAPLSHGGGRIQLSILHFSGAGVYDGSVVGMPALRAAQQALYKEQVLPKVNAALNDDAAIGPALALYFGWGHAFGLIDDEDFMAAERASLRKLWKQVFLNQISRAYDRCKAQHDVIAEIINLNRADFAAGGADALILPEQDLQDIANLAEDLRKKCGSFQLDYDTTLANAGETTSWSVHVHVSSLPLLLFGADGSVNFEPASAPLQIDDFTFSGGCGEHAIGSSPRLPFVVNRLLIEGKEDAPKLELDIQRPGDINGVVAYPDECQTPGTVTLPEMVEAPWVAIYMQQEEAYGFAIRGWNILGGSVWATRTYENRTSETFTEKKTTYTLRHTPE